MSITITRTASFALIIAAAGTTFAFTTLPQEAARASRPEAHDNSHRDASRGSAPKDDDDDGDEDGEVVTEIQFQDAPPSVQDAFARFAKGQAASRVERIVEEHVTRYELEYPDTWGTASVTLASTGEVLELEAPLNAGDLPRAVIQEIQKDFPGATIKSAEAVELHYFEISVVVGGRTVEVTALATGDIEDHLGGHEDEANEGHDDDD